MTIDDITFTILSISVISVLTWARVAGCIVDTSGVLMAIIFIQCTFICINSFWNIIINSNGNISWNKPFMISSVEDKIAENKLKNETSLKIDKNPF